MEKAAEQGWTAFAGTELEFIVFNDTYEAGLGRAATATSRRRTSTTSTTRCWVPRASSRCCATSATTCTPAGWSLESAKGECNLGQHEIAFLFDEVVRTADNHSVYKNGAKEIASLHGKALSFMAKFDEREGNSCHIHMSLRGTDGSVVFADDDGPTDLFRQFVAGVQTHARGVHPAVRAQRQLVQAVRPRVLRSHCCGVGLGQPHLRAAARSATAAGCGSRTGCPAAT